MEISLSSDNENFLQSQIAAGIYNSINEAINAAISIAIAETIISQKHIDEFYKEVEIGWNAMENNDVLDGNEVLKNFKEKYES